MIILGDEWTISVCSIPEELDATATWDENNFTIHIEKNQPDYNKLCSLWHEIMEIITWGYQMNTSDKCCTWTGIKQLDHDQHTILNQTFYDVIMRYKLYV